MEFLDFLEWMKQLPHGKKLITAGETMQMRSNQLFFGFSIGVRSTLHGLRSKMKQNNYRTIVLPQTGLIFQHTFQETTIELSR